MKVGNEAPDSRLFHLVVGSSNPHIEL